MIRSEMEDTLFKSNKYENTTFNVWNDISFFPFIFSHVSLQKFLRYFSYWWMSLFETESDILKQGTKIEHAKERMEKPN